MKAQAYIQLVQLRKRLKNYESEMTTSQVSMVICVLITLISCLTGEWMAIVAAGLTMMIPATAMQLIQGQINRAEEAIFQHRRECGGLDMGNFREFRK